MTGNGTGAIVGDESRLSGHDGGRIPAVVRDYRVFLVSGHYGAGKSEFSVSLARLLRHTARVGSQEEPRAANPGVTGVTLVDLDVVNPYFRSREARDILESEGIAVIGNAMGIDDSVDVPAVPGTIAPVLRDTSMKVVVDLGGDPAGARAIRQFRHLLAGDDVLLLTVVNGFRQETSTVEGICSSMEQISEVVGRPCGGLVNNSHLLHETTADHLRHGDTLCRAVTQRTGVTVQFVSAMREILQECPATVSGVPVVIESILRRDWMKRGNEHMPRSHQSGSGRSSTCPRDM